MPRVQLSTLHSSLSTGFTLIEILVVLGIITMIAALGVPVYNALSGSRSVEAAQNQVAAYLGQARTIAINEGKSAGVMFYVDPATERTAMAIVYVGDISLDDPDPYEKYMSWMSGVQYKTGNLDPDGNGDTTDRTRADRVIGFTSDFNAAYDLNTYPAGPTGAYSDPQRYFGNFRPSLKVWRADVTHNSSPAVHPPREGPSNGPTIPQINTIPTYGGATNSVTESTTGNYGNTNWRVSTGRIISQYGQTEQQLLPKGIGVQVIIQPTARTTGGYQERYLRTGLILFDPQGRLVIRDMVLPKTTTLGEYLEITTPSAPALLSGVGIAFYDDSQFRNLIQTPAVSQSDWIYGGTAPANYYAFSSTSAPLQDLPATEAAEDAEEDWLSNNTVPVMINRYSGSLSETE